jgi:exo-beta-1,3-glucanase (GH17 family)
MKTIITLSLAAIMLGLRCVPSTSVHMPASSAPVQKLLSLNWVAYAPTNFNPDAGLMPDTASMLLDLEALSRAGFTGLVTYGSDGILGRALPGLAERAGLQGIIMGIWNIENEQELVQAKAAARSKIVLGYCVGNEGLGARYSIQQLAAAIADLRTATGLPVATTEQVEDYADPALLNLGDWVFPNVHPYWHNILDAKRAVAWTKAKFDSMRRRTNKAILFKEVGFPTAGNDTQDLSEQLQEEYYVGLAAAGVPFVYFEAFDQPWKQHEAVEPFWGLFTADRTPKRLAVRLMDARK